jgi:hypothetical protein
MKDTEIMFAAIKRNNPDLPNGLGTKWSDLEEQQLLNELEIDMNHTDIAENHKRTIGGIRSRIRQMAYIMHSNGKESTEIMRMLRITETDLKECIRRVSLQKKKREVATNEVAPQTDLTNTITDLTNTITDLTKEVTGLKKEIVSLKKMIHHITMMITNDE